MIVENRYISLISSQHFNGNKRHNEDGLNACHVLNLLICCVGWAPLSMFPVDIKHLLGTE